VRKRIKEKLPFLKALFDDLVYRRMSSFLGTFKSGRVKPCAKV
jgi:hypothetical protein